jgi:hypothetical protein
MEEILLGMRVDMEVVIMVSKKVCLILQASQFERTDLVDYTNQITDLGSILDIRINNTNKESKKNNPEAPSSKTDPMRLIEPQSWLSTHDFLMQEFQQEDGLKVYLVIMELKPQWDSLMEWNLEIGEQED